MEKVMESLCEKLKGWNFEETEEGFHFDFWLNDNAILTMYSEDGEIKISNDVEYYKTEVEFDYIALEEYENNLKGEQND